MKTLELKSDIIQLVKKIEDDSILIAIRILLAKQYSKNKTDDFWEKLPRKVESDINAALKEADLGLGIPHKKAMRQIKTKFVKA